MRKVYLNCIIVSTVDLVVDFLAVNLSNAYAVRVLLPNVIKGAV